MYSCVKTNGDFKFYCTTLLGIFLNLTNFNITKVKKIDCNFRNLY